jgi:hypothetical protein
MNEIVGRVTAILSSTAATVVVAYYVCQAIFEVPLLKSALAISTTIAIIIAEILLIWWLFGHVRHQHRRYDMLLDNPNKPRRLPPGNW